MGRRPGPFENRTLHGGSGHQGSVWGQGVSRPTGKLIAQAVRRLESRLGGWAVERRRVIIAAAFVLSGVAASGTAFLEFSADDRIYFSKDNPQLVAAEAMESTYGETSNVFFAVAPEDGDATSALALDATLWLTDRAWQIPFATRVDSLTNFQHSMADEDDIVVRDLVDGGALGDAAERARVRATALTEPLLAGRLISHDGRASGINVTVALPGEDQMREGALAAEVSYGLAAEVRERFPGIDVRVTGLVIFNQAFMQVSLRDLKTLVPASFAAMMLALLFLTGGLGGTLAIMLVVALSVMVSVGLGGWVGLPMTAPSAIAPVVVLTVAIASCVHIFSSLVHSMQRDASGTLPLPGDDALKRNAIAESMRVNLQPVFLACLTTTLGFLSMNASEVPPLRHLGTFVAFGVVAAFLLSVTLLPALLSMVPIRVRESEDRRDAAMAALGEFVIRRRRLLGWGFGAITVALVASVPRNELNDVFLHYFDESVEFRRDAEFTVENLTGLYTMEYSLPSGEPGGISDPSYLSEVAAFAEWYRAQPETVHVNVITDTFRRLNRSMHGDDPAEYRLPASRELAAQYLLLYELSLPFGLDLDNQVAVDRSATRMTVATRTLSSNEVIALDRRALQWLADHAPNIVRPDSAGGTLMFAHLGRRNIVAMLMGTTIALAGISLVLVFALRSLRLGLASLVPNLVPGALGFGIWG
ncbi:MAG: MMPL family transporter, partial [Boseongicola sp. SB0670_bin_30]|nr:MMPL family transporter [Boseongicola sp. SB0670_bin_30]